MPETVRPQSDLLDTVAAFAEAAIAHVRDNLGASDAAFSCGDTVLTSADLLAVVERCRIAERQVAERDDENSLLAEELRQARELYEHFCMPPETAQLIEERDEAVKRADVLEGHLENLQAEFLRLRAQLKDSSEWGQRAWNAWRSARDRAQRARAAAPVLKTTVGPVTVTYWPAQPSPEEVEAAKRAVIERAAELVREQQATERPGSDLDAAIRARLAEWQRFRRQDGAIAEGYGYDEMAAAIEAVLDRHSTDGDGDCLVCVEWEEDEYGDLMPYRVPGEPCPTKREIAAKLGVEVPDSGPSRGT